MLKQEDQWTACSALCPFSLQKTLICGTKITAEAVKHYFFCVRGHYLSAVLLWLMNMGSSILWPLCCTKHAQLKVKSFDAVLWPLAYKVNLLLLSHPLHYRDCICKISSTCSSPLASVPLRRFRVGENPVWFSSLRSVSSQPLVLNVLGQQEKAEKVFALFSSGRKQP